MAFRVPEPARMTTGPMATESNEGRYGAFLIESPEPGWQLVLICDDGTNDEVAESLGWEHVSVRALRGKQSRIPSWKEMAFVKDLCWDDDDVVVQYHPRKSDYVNLHPHVLHLWCSRLLPFPVPSPQLVGPLSRA
jgi:hypothetical protein